MTKTLMGSQKYDEDPDGIPDPVGVFVIFLHIFLKYAKFWTHVLIFGKYAKYGKYKYGKYFRVKTYEPLWP